MRSTLAMRHGGDRPRCRVRPQGAVSDDLQCRGSKLRRIAPPHCRRSRGEHLSHHVPWTTERERTTPSRCFGAGYAGDGGRPVDLLALRPADGTAHRVASCDAKKPRRPDNGRRSPDLPQDVARDLHEPGARPVRGRGRADRGPLRTRALPPLDRGQAARLPRADPAQAVAVCARGVRAGSLPHRRHARLRLRAGGRWSMPRHPPLPNEGCA